VEKPSFDDRKAAVDAQRHAREDGLRRAGVGDKKAAQIAKTEMDQAVRKLQEEKGW
jgi:hypothetical protein